MTRVAIIRRLCLAILRTLACFNERHVINLTAHFVDLHKFVWRDLFDAPQQFAARGLNHLVANFDKIGVTVDAGLAHRQFTWVLNRRCLRQGCQCAMTRLALNILHIFFRAIHVPIAHRLLRGVAIDTVQLVLAFGKFRNRLIVFNQASAFGRHLRRECARNRR